ncbi:MAG: caspase family protein, partial [Planctomycetes bacterium]|nr:caspase family protein [Planctomycetota bacterium]
MSPRALALSCCLLLAGASLSWGQDDEKARVFVLVIGIDDYADEKISDLSYAERDAQAVYDFFAKDPRSPTVASRVKLLRGKQATLTAVYVAIQNQLIRRATSPKDTAILYFAGHGFTDADGVYLGVHDTQLDVLEPTTISWDLLQRLWRKIGAGRRVFLVDACHSGGLAGLRGPGGIGRRVLGRKGEKERASIVIAATAENQLSVEDKKAKHGVFTHALLQALRGKADSDKDGVVSLGEVSVYLNREVPRQATAAGGNQTPVTRIVGNEPFGRGLTLSRGKAPKSAQAKRFEQVEAERRSAEQARVAAEKREHTLALKLATLEREGSATSAEALRAARDEHAKAQVAAAKARVVAKALRSEEAKHLETKRRAARAEAALAESRLEVARLKKLEGAALAKAAADAAAA